MRVFAGKRTPFGCPCSSCQPDGQPAASRLVHLLVVGCPLQHYVPRVSAIQFILCITLWDWTRILAPHVFDVSLCVCL